MPRDLWRELLSRVLPWFDQDAWNRERAATRRVIARADEEMRNAYRSYGTRMARR